MTVNESAKDVVTVHHMANSLGLARRQATRIAWKFEKKLGLARVPGRSPSGHLVTAYSKVDAKRIVAAQRESEKRRREKAVERLNKATRIQWDTGTARRRDVMSIFEFAETLGISRQYAGRLATRFEADFGIERVPARSASGRAIVAYRRQDGERMIEAYQANPATQLRPAVAVVDPQRQGQELFYLLDLPATPDLFSMGWSGDGATGEAALLAENPQVEIVKTWPCAKAREAAAMNRVFTSRNVEIINGEEFRATDLDSLIAWLDEFFAAESA